MPFRTFMDFFFTSYRDPIFGLIVLVAVVLLIIILSYFWGIFSNKNKQKIIDKFVQKFDRTSDTSAIFLALSTLASQDLIKVGDALARNGDWENAVLMYLDALKKDGKLRQSLLKKLGLAYIKTGFFERAKDAYMQLLATSPRDEQALKKLIFINEKLRDFKACYECCDALGAQNMQNTSVSELRAYLQGIQVSQQDINITQKIELLSAIKPQTPFIKRLILEQKIANFSQIDADDLPALDYCVDLLDERSLLLAKQENSQNSFILELLKAAKAAKIPAKLAFDYECINCGANYPVYFTRCPNCMGANSTKVVAKISKEQK